MKESSDRTGWLMFTAYSLAIVALYVNAFAVPPIISSLVRDRNISHADAGVLMTAFVFVFSFGSVAAGFLADRLGTRLVIGSGLVLASIGTFAFTLTDSYPAMVATRALIGWGAASMFAPGVRFAISWLSPRRSNVIIAVISTSMNIGIAIAFLLTPELAAVFGWEGLLRAYAGAGFVVAIGFIAFCRDNDRAPAMRPSAQVEPASVFNVFGNTTLLLASAGLFLVFFHLYGILTWVPPYLAEVLRLSPGEVGVTSMMLGLAGVPVGLLAGWIVDKTGRTILVIVVGLALAATVLLLNWMGGFAFLVVAALCSIIAAGPSIALVPLFAIPSRVVPPQAVGQATGFASMCAYSGSIVATYLGGFIVTSTNGYDQAFMVYSAAVIVAAVIICPLMERSLRRRLAVAAG